jgi:hypothetical protein
MPMNGLRRLRRVFGGGAGGATGFSASLGLLGATRGDWVTMGCARRLESMTKGADSILTSDQVLTQASPEVESEIGNA